MTISFDVRKKFIEKISAAVHPFDKTARPQFVNKNINSEYYELIKEFKKITGVGVLLNTSFNLHGDAIVENANQAINTFIKSDLDILIINNYAICRRIK